MIFFFFKSWICSNAFSVSIDHVIFVLFCFSIKVEYDIFWFWYIEPILHFRDKFQLVALYNHFSFYIAELIVSVLCWEFLHIYSLEILVYYFFFFCYVWCWCQGNTDFMEWIRKHYLLFCVFFGRVCEGLVLIFL